MNQFDVTVTVTSMPYGELPADDRLLVDLAKEATFRSYAPYSKFRVGAAIRLDNGEIVEGSNQENSAFPSGTCAERSACFYAHARFPEAKFRTIAIAARDTSGNFTAVPTAPCGACRQSLLEYETLAGAPVRVVLYGDETCYVLPSVASLLPLCFAEFD